jgi:hypothetical protein
MSTHTLFEIFVAMHIVTGTVGLVSFWVPVGGPQGRREPRALRQAVTMMMLRRAASRSASR